ncbi:MAG: hypothetical protein ACR2FG_06625 [Marmoricola sp.]
MFDFTPLAKVVGLALAAYFFAWPALAIVLGILAYAFHMNDVPSWVGWMNWPVPALFAILSVVLVVDFFRRLNLGQLTTTQVGGYRMSAVLMVFGAAFALSSAHWLPITVSGVALLLLFLPLRDKTVPSTGEGP